MNITAKELIPVFQELKTASMNVGDNPRTIMDKYNMIFLGAKFNIIYSSELYLSLIDCFHIEIENFRFQGLVPGICDFLSMRYEPMQSLNDMSNPSPHCYQIELW